MLIYLEPILQAKALRLFHYGLNPNGYLILGSSESVGRMAGLFEPAEGRQRFYSRRPGPQPQAETIEEMERPQWTQTVPKSPAIAASAKVMERWSRCCSPRTHPAAVLVDENLEVLQFRGETDAYLEHTSDEATLNLLQLTRSGLDAELRKLVARAAQRSGTVHSGALSLADKGEVRHVKALDHANHHTGVRQAAVPGNVRSGPER